MSALKDFPLWIFIKHLSLFTNFIENQLKIEDLFGEYKAIFTERKSFPIYIFEQNKTKFQGI